MAVVRVHRVPSWVVEFADGTSKMVYTQQIALDLFGSEDGREMNLKIQERVCVADRPGYDRAEDGDCYMCKREESSVS